MLRGWSPTFAMRGPRRVQQAEAALTPQTAELLELFNSMKAKKDAGKGLTDAFGGIHGPKGHIVEAAKVLEACEAFKETDSTGVGAWVREQLANAGLLP